jgi:D-glycero-beta-D-manno-heptose-7-phosphate kinase
VKKSRQSQRESLSAKSDRMQPVDISHLLEIVGEFHTQKIAILADLVLDEFVSGEISRVSREAPVLILRHKERIGLPGGGANAVNNIAALGAGALPVGAVGDDEAGRVLLEYFKVREIDCSGIEVVKDWSTPTKTRFLAGWAHTTKQQVLRVDCEPETPLAAKVKTRIAKKLVQRVGKAGALLVSDYGFGVGDPEMVAALKASKVVTVDSRYGLLKFRRAGIAAATPNEAELEAIYGQAIGNDESQLKQLGRRLLREMRMKALLVTRGRDGMMLFEADGAVRKIPIYGSTNATDVTGAGDTVIAAFTLALAVGASFFEAAHLASFAGGIVVMKQGTATASRAEIEEAIRAAIATP